MTKTNILRNVIAMTICLAVTTMFFASCEDPNDPTQEIEVTGVSLKPTTLSLEVGKTATLTATIAPSDATDKSLTWMSANSKVAVVDNKGTVEAKGTGSTNITVETANGLTATCKVTVTGSGTGNGKTGYFTQKAFTTTKDFVDFFPDGYALAYKFVNLSWSNEVKIYANPTDGSFIYSEISNDPKSSNYGYTTNFYVWEGSNFHGLHFTNFDGHTKFWTVEGNFTGENVVQRTETGSLYAGSFKSIYEGAPSNTSVFSTLIYTNPCTGFIQGTNCEYVEYDKDTTILGIACKKYVRDHAEVAYAGTVISPAYQDAWYVLENGFCLKYASTNPMMGFDTRFEVSEVHTKVSNYDKVIQDFYRPKNTNNAFPTSLSQWDVLTHVRTKEWFNPVPDAWIIPWTAGGVNYTTCWYQYTKNGTEKTLHTYNVNIDLNIVSTADMVAYKNLVKNIPYFTTTSDMDTDDAEFRERTRQGLYALYPDETAEQIEARYQTMLETFNQVRIISFEGNNDTDHPELTFGESYWYVKYDMSGYLTNSTTRILQLKIYWVKVTIV